MMNFKKIGLVLLLFLLFSCVGVVSASSIDENTTFTQDSIDDSLQSTDLEAYDSSDVIIVNDWTELQHYASLTDKDYVVQLKENTNYYPEDVTTNYQIVFNNDMTILGNTGAYIGDSSSNYRQCYQAAMLVPDNNGVGITLQGVNFKWIGTTVDDIGKDGVFLQMGGNANNILKDCHFEDINVECSHSCIVYLKKGTATLEGCTFKNCISNFGCVSIYDPNSVTSAKMYVKDCYFENNYANTEPGCINNCGILEVYNSNFYKNRAYWWAGAIHTHSNANTTIHNSHFTENEAGWNGGALYTYSYLQIYDCEFIGNDCITNNGGGAIGACEYGTGSKPHIYISNSLFKNNENKCWSLSELSTTGTGRGGAISIMDEGSLEVIGSTFIANSAAHGTAIAAIQPSGWGSPDVKIVGNKFIDHTRIDDTLYIELDNSACDISNNYYSGNSIVFSDLSLSTVSLSDDSATFQINAVLANPSYYDADILDKCKYNIYVDGVLYKTIDSRTFTIDFGSREFFTVYVAPSISNSNTNELRVVSPRGYVYVSHSQGSDSNNGYSQDSPVKTISRALELAGARNNILLVDGGFAEENLQVDYDLTITGTDSSKITGPTSNMFTTNKKITFRNVEINGLSGTSLLKQNDGKVILENCIISNNNLANIFDTTSIDIKTSKIINNNGVVVNNNGAVTIKDSIILNSNVIGGSSNNVVLDYNWWGSTLENAAKPTDLNINNWLVLSAVASPSSLEYGKSSTVEFALNAITSTGQTSKYTGLSGFDLSLSASGGTLSTNTANSYSTVTYTLNQFGDGSLTASYQGISTTVNFAFVKTTPAITVQTSDIMYGSNLVVEVSIPSGVTGSVTVTVSDKTQTKTIDSTKLIFTFTNLKANKYTVSAKYSGDNHYKEVTKTATATVSKYSSQLSLSYGTINVGKDLTFTAKASSGATGNVVFYVNSKNSGSSTLSSAQAKFIISKISRGDYTIRAVYNGDDRYLSSEDSVFIEVDNTYSSMTITANDITYGSTAAVSVKLNSDATGTVTATIEGITKSATVSKGTAKVTFTGLGAGSKSVVVDYTGDNNYYSNTKTAKFTVNKSNLNLIVQTSDIKIGQDAIISVPLPANAGGSLNINGEIISVPNDGNVSHSISNLALGTHEITVTYTGDNYNSVSRSVNVTVSDYDPSQWGLTGYDGQNTAKSNYTATANGNIAHTISINKEIVSNLFVDSNGNLILTTPDGIYSFNGNSQNWAFSGVNFTDVAVSRDLIIAPKSSDTLYFINQTTGERYGTSNIYQGSSLYAPVADSNACLYIVSEYQVSSEGYNLVIIPFNIWKTGGSPTLVSLGDVKPVASPTVSTDVIAVLCENKLVIIDAKDLKVTSIKSGNYGDVRPVVGDGGIVYAVLDGNVVAYDASGAQLWQTAIPEKANTLALDKDNGLYTVTSQGELYKLDLLTGSDSKLSDLKVTSGLLIDNGGNIYFGSDNTLYALSSNGKTLWKSITSFNIVGNPVMDKAGNIYVKTANNQVVLFNNADLANPNLNVEIKDKQLTITLDSQATGEVKFNIGSVSYTENSENTITKSLDLTPGSYSIKVSYSGDNRFYNAIKIVDFTVKTNNIEVNKVTDMADYISNSNGSNFDISLPADAKGNLTLTVKDNTYVRNLIDGKASIIVLGLPAGTYNATLTYSGDGKYDKITKVVSFTVTEESSIRIIYDGKSTFSVGLPDDATGTLTVTINENSYTSQLANGFSSITLRDLATGEYNATAVYSGDDMYSSITQNETVTIQKPVLTAKNLSVLYTAAATYTVYVTVNGLPVANKVVTFTVNGVKSTANTNANGYASVKVSLPPKTTAYKLTASYRETTISNTIKVSSIITAKNVNVKKSAKTLKIKITLKKVNNKYLTNKKVTLKISGKTITAKTNKKGVATFTVKKNILSKLKAGKSYKYQVTYLKDTVKKTLKVKK